MSANLFKIDLSDKNTSEQEYYQNFYHNYYSILTLFIKEGCTLSGYKVNSPACYLSEGDKLLKDQDFIKEVKSTLNIDLISLIAWPDLDRRNDQIEQIITKYEEQRALYQSFHNLISKGEKEKQTFISSVFGSKKKEKYLNYRKAIYNIELIMMMYMYRISAAKKQQVEKVSFNEISTESKKCLESLKQNWIFCQENDVYTKKVMKNLITKIYSCMKNLTEAARQWNVLESIIPYDPDVDTSLYNLNVDGEIGHSLVNVAQDLINLINRMGEVDFDDEKIVLDGTTCDDFKRDLEFSGRKFQVAIETVSGTPTVPIPTPVENDSSEVASAEATGFKAGVKTKTPPVVKKDFAHPEMTNDTTQFFDPEPSSNARGPASSTPIKQKKATFNLDEQMSPSPYTKIIESLISSTSKAQVLVDSDTAKKSKLQVTLDDLKKLIELSRNIHLKETDEELEDELKTQIGVAQELALSIADKLDEISDVEVLRRQIPVGSWSEWNGKKDGYMDFRKQMYEHLEAIPNEMLRLTTLKKHMKGRLCDDIKEDLKGVTTLEKAFQILDARFGDIDSQLPDKERELAKLSLFPDDFKTELKHVRELLGYVRICQQFKAVHNINNSFCVKFANRLRQDNAAKMMKTKGNCAQIVALLEEIKNTNQALVNISEEEEGKKLQNFKSRFNNQQFNRSEYNCHVCGGKHKYSKCQDLQNCGSVEAGKQLLQTRRVCCKCLKQIEDSASHICPRSRLDFICADHQVNFLICKCAHGSRIKNNIKKGSTQMRTNTNMLKMNNSQAAIATTLLVEVIKLVDNNGKNHSVLCLYDTGNSNTGIDNSKADVVYGKVPFNQKLVVENFVTGPKNIMGNRRTIKVRTRYGPEEIDVYGVQNLKQQYDQKSFKIPKEWEKLYNLPKNPVSASGTSTMVFGLDHAHLFPREVARKDGVIIMKSVLTNNYILGGKIREQQNPNNIQANRMIFHPYYAPTQEIFQEISTDGIGDSRILKCSSCIQRSEKCVECRKKHKPEPKQQVEYLEAVKNNLSYNEVTKRYTSHYIYNQQLPELPIYKDSALRMMKNFENKIEREGLTDLVNKAFTKFREAGVIKLDTEDPLDENLQQSFVTMCYSKANNEFKNTKLRLCVNSSFKTGEKSISLNEAMLDGPQYLNDVSHVLTRWRCYCRCGHADVKSAYHQVHSCDKDKSLRRIWIKPTAFGKTANENWVTGHCCCCQFGDKLAGAFCSMAIFDAAKRFMKPENASKLRENIVMDDITIGVNGSMAELKEAVSDINSGLDKGSLSVKQWYFTGDNCEEMKFLSYLIDLCNDTLSVRTNFNWSKIKRGARTGPPLEKVEDINDYFIKYPLTKRAVASIVMGVCHDPLGIVQPYINNFKFVYRKLVGQQLDWNDEVGDDIKEEMKTAITMMFNVDKMKFPRRVAFIEAVAIEVLVFFDGSLSGVGVSTVIKNIFKDKPPILRLLKNKSRVTSQDCNTAPRAELLAALIATRVYDILKYELREFIEEYQGDLKFKFIGDSKIVLSQIQKPSYLFKMWAQSKIHEIQNLTKNIGEQVPEWFHTKSQQNVADILTRPYLIKNNLPWLQDLPDVELTSINSQEEVKDLPEVNKKNLRINATLIQPSSTLTLNNIAFYPSCLQMHTNNTKDAIIQESIVNDILMKHSCYFKSKNIIARIFHWKQKSLERTDNFVEAQKKAENVIFKLYQDQREDYIKSFNGGQYYKTEEGGITVLKGRRTILGDTIMKLVPPDTLLYNRISTSYHTKYELSPQFINTQLIKDGYYCPGIVKRLIKIQKNCGKCRRRMQKVDPQQMGMVHEKRLIPSKPFLNVQMDISGPHFCKDFVNQKARTRKVYILVTICDFSRCISLNLVESLSRDHLLAAIQCQFFRYGKSKRIEADFGLNFVAAAKVLDAPELDDDDYKLLQRELQSEGCSLVQRSAKAPFIQGSAEHAVKMTKKAMKYYKSPMTAFCWIQLLEKTMFLLNRRPIGAKMSGQVLTPSDLNPVYSGVDEQLTADPKKGNIAAYHQQAENYFQQFKDSWFEMYYRSVLQQKKWKDLNTSLDEGDLVLIMDMKNEFGYPHIARIVFVKDDTGKIPRYYYCQHKTPKGTLRTVIRTAQSLCLVLKESENQSADQFEPLDPDNDAPVAELPTHQKKVLKVSVQNDPDNIQDIE